MCLGSTPTVGLRFVGLLKDPVADILNEPFVCSHKVGELPPTSLLFCAGACSNDVDVTLQARLKGVFLRRTTVTTVPVSMVTSLSGDLGRTTSAWTGGLYAVEVFHSSHLHTKIVVTLVCSLLACRWRFSHFLFFGCSRLAFDRHPFTYLFRDRCYNRTQPHL